MSRLYPCPYCHRRYRRKASLKRHWAHYRYGGSVPAPAVCAIPPPPASPGPKPFAEFENWVRLAIRTAYDYEESIELLTKQEENHGYQ